MNRMLAWDRETAVLIKYDYLFFFHGGGGGDGLSSQGVTPNPTRHHRSSGFVEPPVSEALRPRSRHPRGVTILCKLPTPVDARMAVNRYPRHPTPHLGGATWAGEGIVITLRVIAPFCTIPPVVVHRQLGGSEGVGQQC